MFEKGYSICRNCNHLKDYNQWCECSIRDERVFYTDESCQFFEWRVDNMNNKFYIDDESKPIVIRNSNNQFCTYDSEFAEKICNWLNEYTLSRKLFFEGLVDNVYGSFMEEFNDMNLEEVLLIKEFCRQLKDMMDES